MEPSRTGRLSRGTKALSHHRGWYALGLATWLSLCVIFYALHWAEPIGLVLRAACAVAAWLFVWRFSRVNWRSTHEGRHIMGYTFITAIFMTLATAVTFFGHFRGIEVVTIALYGWLLELLWERHYLFTQGQKDRERATND